jgi:hypothetical protein
MDLARTLDDLRAGALTAIADKARRGDASAIAQLSARLQRIERARDRYDDVVREVEALVAQSDSHSTEMEREEPRLRVGPNGRDTSGQSPSGQSPRRYAEERRRELIGRLGAEGIELRELRGPIYRTPARTRVGIPFATERQPNRWFLGLPDGQFEQAILLCEPNDGDVLAFSLDEGFCAQYRELLSRDARGQLKFNVSRRGQGQFVLNVPHHEPVDLDPMRERFEDLR